MTAHLRELTVHWTVLTKREQRILELAAEGLSVAATGRKLFLAPQTVKSHRAQVLRKVGARTMTHAVALAYQQRLLLLPEGLPPVRFVLVDGLEYVRPGG